MRQILTAIATVFFALFLAGCSSHHLTGYDAKTAVGKTDNGVGRATLYTGAEVTFHVKCD